LDLADGGGLCTLRRCDTDEKLVREDGRRERGWACGSVD